MKSQIQRDNCSAFGRVPVVKFELSNHARRAVVEREIPIEWIEHTLQEPDLIVADPK